MTATATVSCTLEVAKAAVARSINHTADNHVPGVDECTACDKGRISDPAFTCADCKTAAGVVAELHALAAQTRQAETPDELLAIVVAATEIVEAGDL